MKILSTPIRMSGLFFLALCNSTTTPAQVQKYAAVEDEALAAKTDRLQWLGSYAHMRILNEQAELLAKEEEHERAAHLYERAAQQGLHLPSRSNYPLYFQAATSYRKANRDKDALRMLRNVAELGVDWADFTATDSTLGGLKKYPEFEAILATMRSNMASRRMEYGDPDKARLVFDDIPRFWIAFDLAAKEKSSATKAAIFRRHYLAKGTRGLVDYHWIKTQSADRLVARIEKSPEFYAGIREQTLKATQYEPRIRDAFRRLKTVYPDAFFPPVTFSIGRLNSGGTAGPEGLLIGTEIWSWTEGVPLDGISSGFQSLLKAFSLEQLPLIVVHEQIHALQAYGGEHSLLRNALQEGSADFLAHLVLPEQERAPYYSWGLQHEKRVWERFRKEMGGKKTDDWIGNNGTEYGKEWIADLGYFIGARISEAYYDQASDKQQAIKDLLFVTDARKILDISGYNNRFAIAQ